MWKQLFDSGLFKDAGIFVGAYALLKTARSLCAPAPNPAFESYAFIKAFGYVPILTPLVQIDLTAMRPILREMEHFLELAASANVRCNGFKVNRLASDIARRVETMLQHTKRSSDDTIAIAAMDFERDELPLLLGMLDNTVRNMLLSA